MDIYQIYFKISQFNLIFFILKQFFIFPNSNSQRLLIFFLVSIYVISNTLFAIRLFYFPLRYFKNIFYFLIRDEALKFRLLPSKRKWLGFYRFRTPTEVRLRYSAFCLYCDLHQIRSSVLYIYHSLKKPKHHLPV